LNKRRSSLGPGGKLIVGGLGGLVILFLLWQFVIPFFFSPAQPVTPGTPNQANNSSNTSTTPDLVGSIIDATSTQPIAQAVIKGGDGSQVAQTDEKGQFTIAKLPADKDKLTVTAPGYETVPLPLTADAAKAIQLKPRVTTGTLVDSDTQQPIAGKLVRGGDKATVTDDSGKFTFTGLSDDSKIDVDLIGYQKAEQAVGSTSGDLTVAIKSTSFNGSLTDAQTGKPIANALVKTLDDSNMATTGEDGKFSFSDLTRDDSTQLKVRAPGYKIQTFKATDLAKGAKMNEFKVNAIYVPGVFAIRANYQDLFTPYLEMADKGEINAIVVDMKFDDNGTLWFDSQTDQAKQYKTVRDGGTNPDVLIDVKAMLADAHKHGLYVITRMVIMRDPAIAKANPAWSLKSRATGEPWKDTNGLVWPNPFVPEVADYNAALAKELAGLGVDEVQFDYIRFPTDGKLSDIQYKPDLSWTQLSDDEKLREQTIDNVVKKTYDILKTTDTFLSLDVFGMSLWREDDNNIGQQYNDLVFLTDYICPMVYPTHFEIGTLDQKQYPGPTGNYPGVIITKSGIIANKLEEKLKPIAKYRPWLEDFSLAPVVHTPERVRLQIQAANDNGSWGWTLWNAGGKYTTQILQNFAQAKK
jgi:hypothetical protein